MAITKSKRVIENLTISGLKNNRPLVNHLRHLAYTMISHRGMIGVDAEMAYCRNVVDNKVECVEENALNYEKEIGQAIDGVTAGKRDDAISVHTDLIIGQLDKLFVIAPTPVPNLPKREEDLVVDKVEEVVLAEQQNRIQEAILGYMEQSAINGVVVNEQQAIAALQEAGIQFTPNNQEVFQIAKKLKGAATRFIRKRASSGAKRMEREIADLLVETKYGDELLKFIDDFNTYPYAVMRTGAHLPFTRKVWKGNKWAKEDQNIPVAKRLSPVNFYWSADSLDVNDGTGVCDVLYLRRVDLERMYQFETQVEVKNSLVEVIQQCSAFQSWRNWLEALGHTKENDERETASYWDSGATVACVRIHTLLDACRLRELGLNPDGDLVQYEVEAWLLNEEIIRFKVYDPKGYERPYVVEKFRHLPGRFEGKSLAKILQPLEHQIRSVKRNEILNIGFSSAPIILRNQRAFSDEDESPDGPVTPGDNYDIESMPGDTAKAIEAVTIPNITGQLRTVLFDLYAEADVKSQIPRILTGQGQLGSSVRSASMLATQISGASKNLKRQMWLIALNIVVPHVEHLFEFYMREGDNDRAKVDAAINVGSIEALINREFVLQNVQNLIQYLAPYAEQLPPGTINNLLFQVMQESGIATGDDPELIDEFNSLVSDTQTNLGTPQAQSGVQLDGRSPVESVSAGGLRG